MMNGMDYKSINKELWNAKTDVHVTSEFYDVDSFLKGKQSLKHIELDLIGDVSGKSILHLQCHFGMDSISLSKMGAKVTGVDLSDKAIAQAKELALVCGTDTQFISSDVYELINVHDGKYDIVFTSYGTIGWLPDMQAWANVVSQFLKPEGLVLIVDFHPVLWMMDYQFTRIEYAYFNTAPIIENIEKTYTDGETINKESVSWNHTLSDIIQAMIDNGISIQHFSEYDYSVYDCFENTIKIDEDKFQIEGLESKLPMMYAILGKKV